MVQLASQPFGSTSRPAVTGVGPDGPVANHVDNRHCY